MAKPKNPFKTLEENKKILEPVIRNKTDQEVKIMLCHCAYYKNGRYKKLSEEERILYDILERNGLSSRTLHKHYVLLDYPEEFKELLRQGNMSRDKIQSRYFSLKKMRGDNASKELMTDIRSVMGGLKWRGLKNISLN